MAERKASGGLKPVIKGLALLVILGGFVWLAKNLDLGTDRAWLLAHVRGRGVSGVLFFIAAAALASAIGVPRQITSFFGGYVFGWFGGGLWTTLATGLGCMLVFGLSRTLGRGFVLGRFGRRVGKLNDFLCTAPFRTSLAIRLFPVGHNLTTSALAGVTRIPVAPFILGSMLGYVPLNLVFAIFGAGVNSASGTGRILSLVLSGVLLVGSSWLGISVYRAYRRRGAVPVEEEESGEEEGGVSATGEDPGKDTPHRPPRAGA